MRQCHSDLTPFLSSALVHGITAYNKAVLSDGVKAWFDGGTAVSGAIDPKAASVHTFTGKGGATWEIYPPAAPQNEKVPLAWSSFANPVKLDDTTYGYRWAKDSVTKADSKDGSLVTLPNNIAWKKAPKIRSNGSW